MKALIDLNNYEKGKLLHDLFPKEMPHLIENIQSFCTHFRDNQDQYKESWDDGFINFEYWLALSEQTDTLIKRQKLRIERSSKVFSDQLFFSYTSFFVIDRIIKYADISKNKSFKIAVDLLYKA